jgi:hypothetical protein
LPQVFEQFATGLAHDLAATLRRFIALEAIGASFDAAPGGAVSNRTPGARRS